MATENRKGPGAAGNGSGLLTRQAILAASDLKRDFVDVPEWGGRVIVREMTGTERQTFDGIIADVKQRIRGTGANQVREVDVDVHAEKVRVLLCAMTMVDESGERLFSDADVAALGKKSSKALGRVYEMAAKLSGITDESQEEIEGKSEETPDAARFC